MNRLRFYMEPHKQRELLQEALHMRVDFSAAPNADAALSVEAWDRCEDVVKHCACKEMSTITLAYVFGQVEREVFEGALWQQVERRVEALPLDASDKQALLSPELIGVAAKSLDNLEALLLQNGMTTSLCLDDECHFLDECSLDGTGLEDIPSRWFSRRYHMIPYSSDPWTGNDILELTFEDMCRVLRAYSDLSKALAAEGLRVRSDSRMCEEHVMDQRWEVAQVVSMMKEMHFFVHHTNYRALNRMLMGTCTNASETAKKAAAHHYTGNQDLVPARFKQLNSEEATRALKGVEAARDRGCEEEDTYSDCSDDSDW